jgi:hypothetical protein
MSGGYGRRHRGAERSLSEGFALSHRVSARRTRYKGRASAPNLGAASARKTPERPTDQIDLQNHLSRTTSEPITPLGGIAGRSWTERGWALG